MVNTRSVQSIREGDFKVPELRKLKAPASSGFSDGFASEPKNFSAPGFADLSDDDGELPF